MSAEPLTVVLIGPGGVGKGTLARAISQRDPRLTLSRSWTTRAPRESEDGSEYVFVSPDEFRRAIADERFLEWAEFQGSLYGTPHPDDGSHDTLLEIEVQGAAQVLEQRPDAVVVLVMPPSNSALESRLRARGDDESHVARRLASTPAEVARGRELAAYVVINDDAERAAREILSILEGLRRRRGAPAKD
ncbi:MAG TPA: guanylate kinase [Acidimicrobiales bacterium]|nr:guanylate kinase [Acidimicrobiales bacterium]